MIDVLRKLFTHHLRLGYVFALLIIDVALLVTVASDIYRFAARGLHLPLVFRFDFRSVDQGVKTDTALLAGFLLVGLPIFVALVRIVVGRGVLLRGVWVRGGTRVVVLHGIACIALAYFCIVGARMQIISGIEYPAGDQSYSFLSLYFRLVDSGALNWVLRSALSLTAAAAATVVGFVLVGKGPGRQVELYEARAALADLPGELRPALACARYSFDEGGPSTEIEYVREFEHRAIRQYSHKNPGSREASAYVQQVFGACRTRLEKLLVPSDMPGLSVAISPDAPAALQWLLASIAGAKRVLVLPYAEQHVIAAAKLHGRLSGSDVRVLTLDVADWDRPWEEQQALILRQIIDLPKDDISPVAIATEVSYHTGLRLPMSTFIPRIRECFRESDVKVIVEGSAGAGNGSSQAAIRQADAYVFTTDRWLLSTAPFGVAITSKEFPSSPLGWTGDDDRVPATYWDARRFSNLLGSLDLLTKYKFEYFWNERCRELRKQFLHLLPSQVQIVGSGAGLEPTFCQSVCPVRGKRWRYEADELTEVLQERQIYAPVLRVDPTMPWLRISLPYFLDVREVNCLCDTLSDLIR